MGKCFISIVLVNTVEFWLTLLWVGGWKRTDTLEKDLEKLEMNVSYGQKRWLPPMTLGSPWGESGLCVWHTYTGCSWKSFLKTLFWDNCKKSYRKIHIPFITSCKTIEQYHNQEMNIDTICQPYWGFRFHQGACGGEGACVLKVLCNFITHVELWDHPQSHMTVSSQGSSCGPLKTQSSSPFSLPEPLACTHLFPIFHNFIILRMLSKWNLTMWNLFRLACFH